MSSMKIKGSFGISDNTEVMLIRDDDKITAEVITDDDEKQELAEYIRGNIQKRAEANLVGGYFPYDDLLTAGYKAVTSFMMDYDIVEDNRDGINEEYPEDAVF